MRTTHRTAMLATALFGALGMSTAFAATNATANLGVQLIVTNSCTIATGGAANDMDFLTVNGNIAANIDSTATITVNCNNGAVYHVGLGDGAHSVVVGQRRMTNGSQFVNYELYSDAGRATRWGLTAAGGTATDVDGTGSNANQTLTVYGRVPSPQSVGAGTYNDIVLATIEF